MRERVRSERVDGELSADLLVDAERLLGQTHGMYAVTRVA